MALSQNAGHALVGEQFAILLGREEAGQDGVDADVVRREFPRQELGDLVDARLGHRVGEHLRKRRSGRRRRNIDDGAAVSGIDHGFAEDLASQEDAGQIDIQNALPFGFLMSKNGVPELTPAAFTRMSTWPKRANTSVKACSRAGFAGGVTSQADGGAAQGFDRLARAAAPSLLTSKNRDIGAGAGQARCHGSAEDSAASDNHRHLAGQ